MPSVPRRGETGLRALTATTLIGAGSSAIACLLEVAGFDPAGGRVGVFALPIACMMAAALLARRAACADALALALVVPLAALVLGTDPESRFRLVTLATLSAGLVLVGACLSLSLRRPADPASRRVILSTLAIGPLVPLLWTTLLWTPRHYTMHGYDGRVALHPLIAVAAIAALLAIVDFQLRSARALVWLVVAAVAMDLSPSWGEAAGGCVPVPGPIDWLAMTVVVRRSALGPFALGGLLLRPPVLTALAIAPWIGPSWHALRARSEPSG